MLAIECPRHGRRVLVGLSRIRGLANDPHGIVLDVECWCGQHVRLHTGRLHTGRTHTGPVASQPAPA